MLSDFPRCRLLSSPRAAACSRASHDRRPGLRALLRSFIREYNEVRPHEALGQTPPARTYQGSPRPYPGRLEDPWYDATHQVRRVSPNGQIKWRGDLVFVSEAVCGELVGLAETARGDWTVRFMHVELGRINRQTRKFAAAWHGRRIG